MNRRTLFLIAVLTLVLLAAAGLALAQDQGDPVAGQFTWSDTLCKNCHGENGEGKYAGPRAGDGKSVADWIKQARTPRNRMPAFLPDQVSDQQIADMNAYMQTLPAPSGEFQPIRHVPEEGEHPGLTLMYEKRCIACHQNPAQFVARAVAAGREFTDEHVLGQVRNPFENMPHFSPQQVSDEEALTVADYLRSLQDQAPQDQGTTTPQEPATPATPGTARTFELWDMLAALEGYEWVDLTHSFTPGIPRWPGFPEAKVETIYDYDKDGFFAQVFTNVGQFGTHMDPPAHFHKGKRTIDRIELKEMAAPLVVIDVVEKVAQNPDYELTVDDVKAWEAEYGPVPEGAFVAMRSDWSKRFADVDQFFNKDDKDQAHYPGWTLDALKYLYEERKIVGSGHEPPDTDAALAQLETGFAAETYVLGQDKYQIELLNNLDQVPEAGAIAFIVVPKPKDGSGFPARVFAIVPKS